MEEQKTGVKQVGRVNIVFHILGVLMLKLLGWKVEGGPPDVPKVVVVIAPHTSYWDYPLALFVSWYFHFGGVWFGKSEIFNWPILGRFFPMTGGVPVYRDRHQGLVDQIVETFNQRDHIVFAITPEGTRKKVPYWKSGFYRIALRAKAPLSLGYIDFKRKVLGFGPLYYPTGDVEKDLDVLRSFFSTVTPRHPDRVGPMRFRDDTADLSDG